MQVLKQSIKNMALSMQIENVDGLTNGKTDSDQNTSLQTLVLVILTHKCNKRKRNNHEYVLIKL